jgi:uncharacterized membrane protein YbhN (UPF0104 family)
VFTNISVYGWIRIGLTAIAVGGVFLIADVGKVFTHVTHASAPLLVAGIVLSLLTRLAAAERTYVITRNAGLATTRVQTLAAMFIANFWSFLLPGSIGGGVATVLIYKAMGGAVEVIIAALTASRVAELAAYCALGSITLAWTPHVPASAQVVLVSVAVVTASLFATSRQWTPLLANGSARTHGVSIVAKVRSFGVRTLTSFGAISPGALAPAALFATIQCALEGASVLAFAWAIGLRLDLTEAMWINVAVYIAIFLPLSVGGLGLRDLTVLSALAWIGASPDQALSLSLLMFGATALNGLIGAIVQAFAAPAFPRREGQPGHPPIFR